MKNKISCLVCLAVLAWLLPADLAACTTFCLKDKDRNPVFGRNFDFPVGQGQVHVNQRNQRKTSFVAAPEKPFTWISRYGSISFNQNGREFPYGGMNEAGLVIEQMMNENMSARYPDADGRAGLTELQWIQYQLDVSASVADVLASDKAVRISYTSIAPLHFLVADASGDVVVLDFLDGRTVVHHGRDLPYPALANDPYDVALGIKKKLDAAGGQTAPEATERFTQAARMVEAFPARGGPAVAYAFAILKTVSRGGTQWSIVYDIKNKAIHFRTRGNSAIRRTNLALFDFSCSAAKLFIDIEADAGAPANFKAYGYKSNLKLIDEVWSSVEFLKPIPREQRIARAQYPASVICVKNN